MTLPQQKWTVIKKTEEKVTPELAIQFRDMPCLPTDRLYKRERMEYFKSAILNGTYGNNTQWACAECESDGKLYKVNGTHTSRAFAELLDSGKINSGDYTVTVIKYKVPNYILMTELWATFDSKLSTRREPDQVRCSTYGIPDLEDISFTNLLALFHGLSAGHYGLKGKHKYTTSRRIAVMLDNTKFMKWGDLTLQPKSHTKHMKKEPVIAAMYKTWSESEYLATEFWSMIRQEDEVEEYEEVPPVVVQLRTWLENTGCGRTQSNRMGRRVASSHECLWRCITTYNRWIEGEGTRCIGRNSYTEGMPIPVVIPDRIEA